MSERDHGGYGQDKPCPYCMANHGYYIHKSQAVERAEFGRSQGISGSGVVYWIIQMLVYASIAGSQSSIMTMGTYTTLLNPCLQLLPFHFEAYSRNALKFKADEGSDNSINKFKPFNVEDEYCNEHADKERENK